MLLPDRGAGEIRDRKLYRGTHRTFEAYCQERWAFENRGVPVHRMRRGAKKFVLSAIADKRTPLPLPRTHVRELAASPAETQRTVWQRSLAKAGNDPESVTVSQRRARPALHVNGIAEVHAEPREAPAVNGELSANPNALCDPQKTEFPWRNESRFCGKAESRRPRNRFAMRPETWFPIMAAAPGVRRPAEWPRAAERGAGPEGQG